MSRASAAQRVATAALMIAVIEVCKLTMQSLPNIELTSFLKATHTGSLTCQRWLCPGYVYCRCEHCP